jgi:hypothetical protein
MSVMVNPAAFRKGANTQIGGELGDEPAGLVINWISGRILVRGHSTEFLGGLNDGLLSYASPSTKYVVNGHGIYEAGTTLRCDHDPATLDTSSTNMHTLGIGSGAVVRKALTTTGAVTYVAGQIVRLTDVFDTAGWILGKVVSYAAGALIVDCFDASGYFSAASWKIIVALGVMVEEQRTNLCLNSTNMYPGGGWSGTVAQLTSNVPGPDGTNTATVFQPGVANAQLIQNIAVTPGTVMTFSVYYLMGTGGTDAFKPAIYDNTNAAFILATGQITLTPLVAGKWVRQILTFTIPAGCVSLRVSAVRSITADAGNITFWGAQVEVGASASSYIPTTGAAATRAADNITVGLSALPFNTLAGMIVTEGNFDYLVARSQYLFQIDGPAGNGANRYLLYSNGVNNLIFGALINNGALVQATVGPANTLPFKAAVSWKAGEIAAARNGAAVVKAVTAVPQGMDRLLIGRGAANDQIAGAHLKGFWYVPRSAANDAELQSRSAA